MTAEELANLSPLERAQRLLARQQTTSVSPAEPQFDEDLIPTPDEVHYERTEVDEEIDRILGHFDIVEAYKRWCGKMTPIVGKRKESIMISCPIPGHRDQNPSAWMNSEKGTWYCGGCQTGGDMYDIASFHFNIPNYRESSNFPLLRKMMAEDLGLQIVKGHSGTEYLVPVDPEPEQIEEPESEDAQVINLHPREDAPIPVQSYKQMFGENANSLHIDWEGLIKPGTFLWDWMQACTIDDLPHEYYFWLGLQALGFTGKTNVMLDDFKMVKPNLNLCLYGPTGGGKSRSLDPYLRLIRTAMPFQVDDPYTDPSGVMVLPVPGSSEALIDSLRHEVLDGSTNQVDHLAQIVGLVKFEEFASFVSKGNRPGSSLKEIMIELYDITDADITIHSRGSGRVTAHNPFVQVCTTTQPNAIHAYLNRTDTESGFLNRWVFAAGVPRVEPIPYGLRRINIDGPADKLQECLKWCDRKHMLTLEGNALKAWTSFFNINIAPQRSGKVDTDSIFSRIELLIKKIIVLLTINERLTSPTAEIVEVATSLNTYLATTFGLVSGDIAHSDAVACQNTLVKVIQDYEHETGKSPSRREILRGIGKRFDIDTVDKTLKVLLSMEVVLETKPPPGAKGRPATRYTCGA